jgi:hypothetical protein
MSSPRFFSLREITHSDIAKAEGIPNELPAELLPSASWLIAGLERVRHFLGKPMLISSGYRCPRLNKRVGGEEESRHLRAEAADFVCPDFGPPRDVCLALSDPHVMRLLGIDQLIHEGSWIHISFSPEPRYVALTARRGQFVAGII